MPHDLIRKVEVTAVVELPRTLVRPVHAALRPEIVHRPSRWIDVRLRRQENRIILHFSAHRTAQVRAALNSYLRLLEAAVGALEAADAR